MQVNSEVHETPYPFLVSVSFMLCIAMSCRTGRAETRWLCSSGRLSKASHVFMRWKEQCFLDAAEDCGLTIAGFYYVCLNRMTGDVDGALTAIFPDLPGHLTGSDLLRFVLVLCTAVLLSACRHLALNGACTLCPVEQPAHAAAEERHALQQQHAEKPSPVPIDGMSCRGVCGSAQRAQSQAAAACSQPRRARHALIWSVSVPMMSQACGERYGQLQHMIAL